MTTVDMGDLEQIIADEAARIVNDAAELVLASCKEDCPVGAESPTRRTAPGTLRDSLEIFGTELSPPLFTVSIGSDLSYSDFTDEVDTAPHMIFPVVAKRLRFWWENGPIGPAIYQFAHVNHPGTKGQHWFASKNAARWDQALDQVGGG